MLCYVIETGKRLVNVISQLCDSSPSACLTQERILKMKLVKKLVANKEGKKDEKGNVIQYNNYYVVFDLEGKEVRVLVKPFNKEDARKLSLIAQRYDD